VLLPGGSSDSIRLSLEDARRTVTGPAVAPNNPIAPSLAELRPGARQFAGCCSFDARSVVKSRYEPSNQTSPVRWFSRAITQAAREDASVGLRTALSLALRSDTDITCAVEAASMTRVAR
jgi:hypothetical protein